MPAVTRWFIKAALVYFVAALAVGLLLALRGVLPLPPLVGALLPVYFHLLMVGWVTQLIFGVIFWMFPKYSREKPRGSTGLAWATFVLLNLGLLLRVPGEPAQALAPQAGWGWPLALSAALQWLGGMAFVINTWGRVKER